MSSSPKKIPFNFIKVREDFVCCNCETKVTGNGYTNHCPNCLCSLHVDDNIGDRSSKCGGLMIAFAVSLKGTEFHQIRFRCQNCGLERPNKVQELDDLDKLAKLLN